jgi:pyocin large subunit-like protein
MEAAGDVSLNDEEQKLPEKYNSASVDVLEGKTDEVVLANVNTEEKTAASDLKFRKKKYLDEHYEKHGVEMGFASAEEYLAAANKVLDNPNVLHKKEKEDDDEVYYLEETNEFVVVSDDGYIRTYFYPSAGIDYYNRQ